MKVEVMKVEVGGRELEVEVEDRVPWEAIGKDVVCIVCNARARIDSFVVRVVLMTRKNALLDERLVEARSRKEAVEKAIAKALRDKAFRLNQRWLAKALIVGPIFFLGEDHLGRVIACGQIIEVKVKEVKTCDPRSSS